MKYSQCDKFLGDSEKKNATIPENCPARHSKFMWIDSKTLAYFSEWTQLC